MVRLRRACPEWGWGEWRVLDTGDPVVFALAAEWQGGVVLAVHDLAGDERAAGARAGASAAGPRA